MKKTVSFLITFLCTFFLHAQENHTPLSRLITYSVDVQWNEHTDSLSFTNSNLLYTNLDKNWYVHNLLAPDRRAFIKNLHAAAYEGRLDVYDPIYEVEGDNPIFRKLSLFFIKSMLNDTVFTTYQKPYPPYDTYDSITVTPHDIVSEVDQIQFLEQWTYNPETFEFHKQVLAFAPTVKIYDPKGIYRGTKTLYWVKCVK